MIYSFLCTQGLEPWDWRSPEDPGIGGSETAIVEISRRLAKRGHDVRVYCHTRPDTVDDGPVKWASVFDPINLAEHGCWWLCRDPSLADYFPVEHPGQKVFLRCDDLHYGREDEHHALTPDRYSKLDGILLMSEPIREYFPSVYPFVEQSKISTRGCGIASDRLRKLKPQKREPFDVIWASSPDRGLENAIKIFHLAHKVEPRLRFHIHYGWSGVDRAIEQDPDSPLKAMKERIFSLPQDGLIWHNRTTKDELFRSYQYANTWLYPTNFAETGCVAAQEAQALGAIPICPPLFALRDKVRNGIVIQGDVDAPETHKVYRDALLKLAHDSALCRYIRSAMIPSALDEFDWELAVDEHETLAGCRTPAAWIVRKNHGVNASKRMVG